MANDRSSCCVTGASMNMAISIFGFILSALFIMVICCRLFCSRFLLRHASADASERTVSIERSIQGLEPSIFMCFPTIKYDRQLFVYVEDNMCTICIADYKERELLRILPNCGHTFHVACIDMWLRQHYTCPICRISFRIFSEQKQISDPLISFPAKSRFVPGAVPDHLFEQPKDQKTIVKNAAIQATTIRVASEMGESSSSKRYQGSKAMRPQQHLESDSPDYSGTIVISVN